MTNVATPRRLLEAADEILTWPDPETAGLWPRAAALLGRQALEHGLDEFWRQKAPGVETCSTHAQLLCLRRYADESVAEDAGFVWGVLSHACHHHPYDLSPTAAELRAWLETVEEILSRLQE